MNNKRRQKPLVLCMNTHLPDASAAVSVLGWAVHPVNSEQEAIQAMHKRSYKAMIVGMDTNIPQACSPLVGYACRAAPAMYRIVYSTMPLINREVANSCFCCGADAVVTSPESLARALCSLAHFQSVVQAGTKIASASIYSSYGPVRRRQQREDQLICIAKGAATVRVKNVRVYTQRLEREVRSVPARFLPKICDGEKSRKKRFIRMVHVSDTNNHHRYLYLPSGDLFVHTGNFTNPQLAKSDSIQVFEDFLDWIHSIVVPKFQRVVFIAGNHDDILDGVNHHFLREHLEARQILHDFLKEHPTVRYLENTCTTFRGLKIYGSPTAYCHHVSNNAYSGAFERSLEDDEIEKKESLDGIDICLTNRAPSILDSAANYVLPVDHVYKAATNQQKKRSRTPRVHAFGHCNEKFGIGYCRDTLVMNGSQELLHNLDKYGGGTPLVADIPLNATKDITRHTIF